MIRKMCVGVAAIGAAVLSVPAQAGEFLNEPALYWQVEFGGKTEGKRQLGVALRSEDGSVPAAVSVVGLEVVGKAMSLSVAGMPVSGPAHQLGQAEDAEVGEAAGEGPWYTQQWAWWVGGGALAVVAYSATEGDDEAAATTTTPANSGSTSEDVCLVDPVCVPSELPSVPVGFTARNAASGWDASERGNWFDAGTGAMGDLAAH